MASETDTTLVAAATQRLKPLIDWFLSLRVVRVYLHYSQETGALLGAGMAYQALFAVFAAIWVGFSIAGLVVGSDPELLKAVMIFISESIPGLIGRDGAIEPAQLLSANLLSWTGAIALVGLLWTALGFLASARDAIRRIFAVPPEPTNFFLLKVRDLAVALAFGVAVILSTGISVFSTTALDTILSWFGISHETDAARIATRVVGLSVVFILDTAVLAAFFRFLSGLRIPLKQLLIGSALGAAALGILKALGTTLLAGATRNPLLASFAVIVGLLIWFNLICQVILIAASWIHISISAKGIDPRRMSEIQLEEERLAREKAARILLRDAAIRDLTEEIEESKHRPIKRRRLQGRRSRLRQEQSEETAGE